MVRAAQMELMMLCRRFSLALTFSLAISTSAAAQIAGTANEVAQFAPVDASALGVTRGASIGLSAGNTEYVVNGGVGLGGGSLRGFVGAHREALSLGAGFAQTFAARPLTSGIHASVGGQLVGGYQYNRYGPHNSAALNLTIPLALTLGDANRPAIEGPSLALYAAPYAELGMMHTYTFDCPVPTQCSLDDKGLGGIAAAGIGAGTRASFGRFALEIMLRDFFSRDLHWQKGGGSGTLGLSYRLGQ
jgi:hypothetical protein